ncbi:MAG: hypothetical protein SV375_09880 [Thermodesulfobacteriota bacterium]|nr:hypothetical protein [Thermodesulfobacteriota bacterium]
MDTFTKTKEFVINSRYIQDRKNTIAGLDLSSIDEPIMDIVSAFAELPYCFPLQSCFGHFICDPEQDIHTLDPIFTDYQGSVRYRIAYIAVCIENSRYGRIFRESLTKIPTLDPAYIHFGSAGWFWERFVNSYVLQIEPVAHIGEDETILEPTEARQVQMVRDLFFEELRNLVCMNMTNRLTLRIS